MFVDVSWRRGWDSNPRTACTVNGFRDRPVRPLRHLSVKGQLSPHCPEQSTASNREGFEPYESPIVASSAHTRGARPLPYESPILASRATPLNGRGPGLFEPSVELPLHTGFPARAPSKATRVTSPNGRGLAAPLKD